MSKTPSVNINEEVKSLRELYAAGEKRLVELGDNVFVSGEGKWSPAQHLHHLVLANTSITRLIPALKSGKFSAKSAPAMPKRLEKLYKGQFPTGGTSPDKLDPRKLEPGNGADELAESELLEAWRKSVKAIGAFENQDLDSEYRLEHFYYGPLNPSEWLKFMGVHTRHHLRLIGAVD